MAAAALSEPSPDALREASAWGDIDGTWQPIFGSFPEKGMSIEWHDFSTPRDVDWSRSFHPESLEICLNFSGHASLGSGSRAAALGPEQVAYYTTAGDRLDAGRATGHLHRFFTLELSASFLRGHLGESAGGLRPEVRRFLDNPERAKPVNRVAPMAPALLTHRLHLLEPPIQQAAKPVWYQSKVTEVLSHLLFEADAPGELFCHRQRRLNRERCERVLFLLERDLENPPSLEMLAAEVGCSPFHLSRLFAQETGTSIPKYLRRKRIEKAGEYLRSGRMNVTEAAFAVGYASLSAFNKAFVDHFGCCPGLYPHARVPHRPIEAD